MIEGRGGSGKEKEKGGKESHNKSVCHERKRKRQHTILWRIPISEFWIVWCC